MNQIKTVKDLPKSERPYEKCMEHGPGVLSDAELLAVILKTGTKDLSSVELAREILTINKDYEGLIGIFHLSYEELLKIRGIGPVKAVQLLCLGELTKRMAKSTARERLSFSSPDTIADYFMEQLRHSDREKVMVLFFDGKHGLIKESMISMGTVNAAPSSPREVYLEALRVCAVYLILIHNHPSGNPTPSRQDIILTKRMKEAGEMIGIELSDHIIIGDQCYYSFREEHLVFS
ncbi:MAG: DNA repair protein RadC [Lachnospiraceae bacterium]|nr:DNA repair protein RadC [Lachnospiraceae bacterium]